MKQKFVTPAKAGDLLKQDSCWSLARTTIRVGNDKLFLVALLLCVLPLTACGHKGRLKTPSQIEAEEQKKARKEVKKAAEEEKKKNPSPLAGEE
ncbi:MAG: hypothetical protein ACK502_08830 [Alphaproteobacteria bacterium]